MNSLIPYIAIASVLVIILYFAWAWRYAPAPAPSGPCINLDPEPLGEFQVRPLVYDKNGNLVPPSMTRQEKRMLRRHWMDNPYIIVPAVCIFLICPVFWLLAIAAWVGGSEFTQYTRAWHKGEDHTRFGTGRIVNLDHMAHDSRTCQNCKREVPKNKPCVWGCDDESNVVTTLYPDTLRLNP